MPKPPNLPFLAFSPPAKLPLASMARIALAATRSRTSSSLAVAPGSPPPSTPDKSPPLRSTTRKSNNRSEERRVGKECRSRCDWSSDVCSSDLSLSDLLVFGRRAGLSAAQHARQVSAPSIDNSQIEQSERELLAPFSNTGAESPYAVHRDLQEVMQNLVGIFRAEEDLKRALVELEKLRVRASKAGVEGSRLFNPGWHLSYDLKAMLTISEAVAHSALARKESRGAHSRIDYPDLDSDWEKKHNVIVRENGTMQRRENPVEEMPAELKQILAEDKS